MAFTEMYGFETKDGQQARVDLSQIRSVLPSGSASGYVKVVLDGGNSVTIKGTVDGVYDLIVHYCGKRTETTPPRVRVSGVGTGVGTALINSEDDRLHYAKQRSRDQTLSQAIELVNQTNSCGEALDVLHKMLTGAIPAPKASTDDDLEQHLNAAPKRVSLDGKAVGVIAGGAVGEAIGNTTPHASRGTSDAYQRLGAHLVSRIPESLRRMTYERPNAAWQTESPRSLLRRISEETDHVLSCMLRGQYAEDVWSQLADVAAAAFLVGDSYEAKRWAPTSADGSGL